MKGVEPFTVRVNGKWEFICKDEQTMDKFLRFIKQKNVYAISAMIDSCDVIKMKIKIE